MNLVPRRLWSSPWTWMPIWLVLLRLHEVVDAEISNDNAALVRLIVDKIQNWNEKWRCDCESRPFITLSFAQSLDGKIALQNEDLSLSTNLAISGEESLYMTHALRSIHDAILVGGNTLLIDNPRLSNRLFGTAQPRPIILDADLKYVFKLGSKRNVRSPIVCCSAEAIKNVDIEATDLTLVPCRIDHQGRLDLDDVLHQLSSIFHIRSIMVEGGATTLSAFVSRGLVDCLCVTIAPKVIGRGIPAFTINSMIELEKYNTSFIPLGQDCVFLSQVKL